MFSRRDNLQRNIKRILAIDWDHRSLRIVHASLSKKGPKIERMLTVAIPPEVDTDDPEQMGGHIRSALDQEGIRTRHAVVDIPRDQAILNTLSLPTANINSLPSMVQIQIAKELPFPVNEAAVDFTVPPAGDDDGEAVGDVLVAAVRREVLEQYEQTCIAGGLKLVRIGLRPWANMAAVCELLRESLPSRVLFVDVGPSLTEIDVIRNGHLAFSRAASVALPRSLEDSLKLALLSDDEDERHEVDPGDTSLITASPLEVTRTLLLEVRRSLEAYRAHDHAAQLDRVVVGGDQGVEEALAEAIEQELGISAETYNPATSFDWDLEEGREAGAFAAALGLVIDHAAEDRLHFDFLHPKETISETQEKLKRTPAIAAVIAFFVIACVVGVEGLTREKETLLSQKQEEIKKLKDRKHVSENKKFMRVLEDAQSFDEEQFVWVDVLYEVISGLPSTQTLVIDEISFNQRDDKITIDTRGTTRDAASKAIEKIESYRRGGKTKPRFKATMGGQTEDARERYRFKQELIVKILDDRSKEEKKSSNKKK